MLVVLAVIRVLLRVSVIRPAVDGVYAVRAALSRRGYRHAMLCFDMLGAGECSLWLLWL